MVFKSPRFDSQTLQIIGETWRDFEQLAKDENYVVQCRSFDAHYSQAFTLIAETFCEGTSFLTNAFDGLVFLKIRIWSSGDVPRLVVQTSS
jgi:hypothetical protein